MFSNQISVVVKGSELPAQLPGFPPSVPCRLTLIAFDCVFICMVCLSVGLSVRWSVGLVTFFPSLLQVFVLFLLFACCVIFISFCALLSCVFYAFCQHFVFSCFCVLFQCSLLPLMKCFDFSSVLPAYISTMCKNHWDICFETNIKELLTHFSRPSSAFIACLAA